jgi:hypothetical protein
VVKLLGPRRCGKTTLARQLVEAESLNYFDLEDPSSLSRLAEPMTALSGLRGLVVIDEVQRRPCCGFGPCRPTITVRPGRPRTWRDLSESRNLPSAVASTC